MLVLPTEKIPAQSVNPKSIILYGKYKSGKTTIAASLEGNLLVDLEGGSFFLDALAVQARTVEDLGQIASTIRNTIKEKGCYPYKYITIDNASRLEEICLPYAATLYRQTVMGKAYHGTDVRTLPNGSGYTYLREAVKKVISMFRELCDTFILIGHVKEKMINKEGEELSEMQIDLVGKLGDIVCGTTDAVGYVYRIKNETRVSFKGGENTLSEARAKHLAGKVITIADSDEEGNVTVYWDKIFLPENK